MNEDFDFCLKALCKGFEIWVNGDHPCRHYHTYEMLDMLRMANAQTLQYQRLLCAFLGQSVPSLAELQSYVNGRP